MQPDKAGQRHARVASAQTGPPSAPLLTHWLTPYPHLSLPPQFCDDCWRSHLRVQIGEGKARHVVCMAHKCNIVCDEELVAKVMKVWGARAHARVL